VRDDGYKFIRAPRPELYDLRADPHELNNLYSTQPRVAARLNNELTSIMNESQRHAVKASASPMTRETEESLQALGYLAPHGERTGMQGMDPKDGLPIHNKLEDARHWAQRGEWQRAEPLVLEVLAATPRNVSALNVLGLIGVKEGDGDKAFKYYQESLAIDPDQFRVHGVLGALNMTQGDLDGAEKEFRKALAINPNFAEAMANMGFI
ncbi:MAG: tetratricopeptide repeat protein, partial [Terriglobia bacterium]